MRGGITRRAAVEHVLEEVADAVLLGRLVARPHLDEHGHAGALEVWLGVESGSQKILDAMDKGTLVGGARTATQLLRKHGVRVCWFIQLGYPSEEWQDIIATRDLIRDESPDEIGVSVA